MEIVPLRQISTGTSEKLDAMVLAISDVDSTFDITTDIMHDIKAPRARAGCSPREEEATTRRVLMDASVKIAVGDVDLAAM